MPTFPHEVLRRLAVDLLMAVGTPEGNAEAVSDSLVGANLAGHDSHGVIRLEWYIRQVREGKVKPGSQPVVLSQEKAAARVDGAWGWGQLATRFAAATAVELAREYGIGAVTIGRCNHIGRLGEYADRIARQGLIGHMLCNAVSIVTPFGGRKRLLGTNPIAWAVPRAAGHEPLVADFATSVLAEGKLRVARDKGEHVASGVIIDREGRPTQAPEDFYAGGMLLPLGGYKGYALSVMVELLGGALSGMAPSPLPEFGKGNGVLVLALNISAFIPFDQFIAQVEAFCAQLKACPTGEGCDEVLLPGEPELRARERRLAEGIPVPEQTWRQLQALADELGVKVP